MYLTLFILKYSYFKKVYKTLSFVPIYLVISTFYIYIYNPLVFLIKPLEA